MKKNIKRLFAALLFAALLTLSACQNSGAPSSGQPEDPSSSQSEEVPPSRGPGSPVDGYDLTTTDNAYYYIRTGYLSQAEQKEFIALCEQGIIDVKAYLGEEYLYHTAKLVYWLETDTEGASSSDKFGNVTLRYVKEKEAEYLHETVHALAGFHNPVWFDEGLATYLNHQYSAWTTPPDYKEDLDQLTHQFIVTEGHEEITSLSDEVMISDGRFRAYVASASLVQYLEKNFGKEKMMACLDNFKQADAILGEDFQQVKMRWLDEIRSLNSVG